VGLRLITKRYQESAYQLRSNLLLQKGTAPLELAICMPLLLLLLGALVDVGSALNQYLVAERIAYEGGRYAAIVRGLDVSPGCYGDACSAPLPYTTAVLQLRTRIENLLTDMGYTSGTKVTITIGSDVYPDPRGGNAQKQFYYSDVEVTLPVKLAISSFNAFDVTARIRSPYLFPDKTT